MATTTAEDPAKNDTEDVPDEQFEAKAAAAAARSRKIKAVGLVAGLTIVMMAVGYIFMPESPSEESVIADDSVPAVDELADDTKEVEIGKFNCTNTRAGIDVSVHVNFTLFAEVQKSNEQAFRDAKTIHEARIRDIVNRVARSASRDDLNDPALDTIKREFREGINRIVRKHYIIQVHIPDWQTMER